jgi:hypothetical protein
MKKAYIILLILGIFCSTAFADRQLDKQEISDILAELTAVPVKGWITTGTIEALHEEYRAPNTTDSNEINLRITEAVQEYSDNPNKIQKTEKLQAMRAEAIPFNVRYKLSNEYTMKSKTIVKVDEENFHWKTQVNSRTDSVKKPAQLKDNFLTDEFDLGCNEERIFSWDGLKYITYFKPVNHAIVTKERGKVNGSLTAGVIRWGYGSYTLQSLSQADLTGLETETDGQKQLHLTAVRADGTEETFVLDPARGYAVKQYSAYLPDNVFILRVYDGYSQTAGKWCPASILAERYDTTQSPHRLLARDIWDFTTISEQRPSAADFEVHYDIDAFIEDFCFGAEPLRYRYSAPQPPSAKRIDTDELISQRLLIAAASRQNCATASLKYICDNLGIDSSLGKLSSLTENENGTTLAQIKQFASDLDLATCAIRTDIKTLKNLSDCQVIIYLPSDNHFAVLGDIDDKYVRLIDLSSDSFYSRYSIENFDSIWDGTVLLVSKTGVKLAGRVTEIDTDQLTGITGVADCEQCNNPCSSSGNSPCTYVPPSCGVHTIYYSRTCCGSADSGSCSESSLIYKKTETCSTDPVEGGCDGNGDWTSSTMSACG